MIIMLRNAQIDGVPHLQTAITDTKSAQDYMAAVAKQNAGADPNDLLYSLEASQDYDPEPGLSQIRAKVYALNFSDDEFNLAHWRRCGFDDVFQLPEFVLEGARLRREVRALWRRPS
jgi:hypothetical protein